MTPRLSFAHRQRGAAALIVTLALLFAMLVATVFVNRNLLVEQHSARNHERATQAFEAAEAGLEWVMGQLNNPLRLDTACVPSTAAAASAFRARYLRIDMRSGRLTPAEWIDAGVARPLRASCMRVGDRWACSCPTDALPNLPLSSDAEAAPTFSIELTAAARPGTVRVVSTGCSRAVNPCSVDNNDRNGASARVEVTAALLPALRTPPAAALTARGAVATAARIGAHNADPESGIAIHAGGAIDVPAAQLTTAAGASLGDALLPNDPALLGSSAARFFASRFGLGKTDWSAQPGVTRIECSGGDCAAATLRAIDAAGTPALIWIDGDLALDGPIALGTRERPVVLIVSGAARLSGAVTFHGVLHAGAVSWASPAPGALLRGALLSETSYSGDGTPALVYDTAVLATLQRASGSFVRVSGSWRDF